MYICSKSNLFAVTKNKNIPCRNGCFSLFRIVEAADLFPAGARVVLLYFMKLPCMPEGICNVRHSATMSLDLITTFLHYPLLLVFMFICAVICIHVLRKSVYFLYVLRCCYFRTFMATGAFETLAFIISY